MSTLRRQRAGRACYKYFNITPEHVVQEAKAALGK